jgi:putative ABC transport system permease protein
MFSNYLMVALRNLTRNKGFATLNILGLSIGIAAAALIFLWIEDELSYNDYFKNKQNIYIVKNNQTYDGITFTFDATPGLLAAGMQADLPGIKHAARCSWPATVLYTVGDKRIYEQGYYIDSSFLKIFDLRFRSGLPPNVFADPQSVLISEKMAKKFFGEVDVTGKSILFDNKQSFIIRGVFKDLPENVTFKAEWFAPFKVYLDNNAWLQHWANNGTQTYVLVEPSANVDQLNKRLYNYILSKDEDAKYAKPFIFPMEKWRLYDKFVNGRQDGGRIKYVKIFGVIAWAILLIACINFMNLATARSDRRAKEVGIRKVLGAEKKMLMGQFILESIMLSILSAFIAIGLIALVLPGFNVLVEKNLFIDLLKPAHLFFIVTIILLCGLMSGSYPAFYLSSFNPAKVLKGLKITSGIGEMNLRKTLVIVQFTASIILIISTILVYMQIQYAKKRELGFSKEKLVYTNLTGNMHDKFFVIKDQLITSGVVSNAAMSMGSVLRMGSNTGDYLWEGKDPDKEVLITQERVTPEYIPTMGITLKEGKNFSTNMLADSGNVIINETLARIIGKKQLIGSTVTQGVGGSTFTIIGVIKDYLYNNMYSKPAPLMIFSDTSFNNYMTMRLKENGDMGASLKKIESIIHAINPAFPMEFKFVDSEFDKFFKSEQLVGQLSSAFSMLAIFISCLGLFGLAAYTAQRRTREIGIRKVLGATVTNLATLMSKDFVQLVIVSCLVAFPIAWWMMYNWLQDYEYRITIQWWVFVVSAIAAIMIAIATVSYQAIKAAISDPVKNLRTE